MSEIWLRVIIREGSLPIVSPALREACRYLVDNTLTAHSSAVDTSSTGDAQSAAFHEATLRIPRLSEDAVFEAEFVTTVSKLAAEIEGRPFSVARDLMVLCVLPQSGDNRWRGWAGGVKQLRLRFPEVCFRFWILPDKANLPQAFEGGVSAEQQDWAAVGGFFAGYREWFDPLGLRRRLRAEIWNCEAAAGRLARAFIFEDEREYAEFLSYAAYRSGRYTAEVVNSELRCQQFRNDWGRNSQDSEPADDLTNVVVHSYALPFGPFKDKKGEALRKAWLEFPSAAESDDWSNSWMRMLVTGKIDEIEIVKPEDWGVDLRNLGWTVAEHNKERIRGLRKPLPWLHGLLKTGLFPNAKDVSVDCIFFDCHDRKHQGHSAVQVAQEAAEHLIRRARAALEAHDPLIAAILALDAVRLLGGYSATLFLDGVDVLYMAEVALELELGSASAGDPSGDTAARVGEYRELLRYLGIKNLLSGSVQASSRERLWTSLRQAYLDSGSFEGADQALLEVHSARTERLTMRLRETLKRSVGWWLIQKPLGAIPQAAKYATVPLLIVLAGLILLSNPETLAWIRVHAWWALLVPLVTFIGLGWSLACYPGGAGWVAAAIRVRAWLCVSILSILLLSTGNLILIGEVSEGTQQTPRTPTVNAAQASADTRWSSALVHLADGAFWTAGDVLGAATLPDTLQLLGRKTIFQRRDHRNAAESLLWLENLFTGWLLFAFGLSAIYRRAMRG